MGFANTFIGHTGYRHSLECPAIPANPHGRNCHDIGAQTDGQRLSLCRVDLAGHDGRSGLVFGKISFGPTVTGAGAQQRCRWRSLKTAIRDGFQRAREHDIAVRAAQRLELVGCGDEAAGRLMRRESRRRPFRQSRLRVFQPCATAVPPCGQFRRCRAGTPSTVPDPLF